MSDGSRLRQSWYTALNEAEVAFKQLISSPATDWKRLSNSLDSSSAKQKGKAKVSSLPEPTDVLLHRCSSGGEDVYRMTLDVPIGDESVSLDPWRAVLTTPELRKEWDPAVEDAHLVEVFDHISRICKTNYMLGWPANPRDSITISRAFRDTTTLVDITTSLPRSADEPAYLRPSPPFVRSHVHLFAWCIQYILPQSTSTEPKKARKGGRLRITCFWQHDLKSLWGFGLSTSALVQQLSTMTVSLFKTVMKRGGRVGKLAGYGNGISIERMRYQIDREALVLDYAVIPNEDDHHETGLHGMDEVHALREHRRLTRSIECVLPSLEGWDVQITLQGSSEEVEKTPWSAHAMRSSSTLSATEQILLRITHGALTDDDAVLKIKVVIEVSGATRGLRLNGLATKIHDHDDRDPTSHVISQKILQDVASAVDMSTQKSSSSLGSVSTTGSLAGGQPMSRNTDRTPAAQKSILSKVRRNYIYFSSLLQEPEAKWRRTTEARGVSITQLDSIDPTLVVYRAEATFVGVNLWDLYATVISPGARAYWDKQYEDDVLLEDVNEMTELWHFKTKPAWPVFGRDAVVLKTVYKSPTTIHVFYFSAEDPHLFPNIPSADSNVIRTQIDLQGWAIESLSPTTTLLTLLEQSDPKGWTGKTSIPTQMINTVAGIGEFAIKCGGPPIVTRISGAKANELRYDQEKGSSKIEYEPSLNRRLNNDGNNTSEDNGSGSLPTIELELRCDLDTWAASLDIVVDPPPQTISCLRRHRLSAEGGGLWLTLTHDSILMDDERLLAIVRRAPGKEKGLVMVNGTKVSVDVEELPEQEIKSLAKQKRVKPPRIPLDQPPVMGVIRRRKSDWTAGDSDKSNTEAGGEITDGNGNSSTTGASVSAPKMPSPLARFLSYAVDQATTTTQQAVAAIAPATYAVGTPMLDPTKLPMQYALEALAWAQEFNSKPQANGWTAVYEKGMTMHKKLIPEISSYIPVHKGVKVIEGVAAEEVVPIITEYDCRKTWDDRYSSAKVLESYGGQAQTTFLVAKSGFPFRDRGLFLASVVARPFTNHSSSSSSSRRNTVAVPVHVSSACNTVFCVSASFSPDAAKAFSTEKYNPYGLPIGRVYVDAWILETLDPYTTENYAIPSTRCTRLVAVDYSGSIPAAVNSMINTTMARGVLAIEAYVKNNVNAALPITRLPASGLVISDKRPEDHAGAALSTSGGAGSVEGGLVVSAPFMAWKLKKRDDNRLLLETKFDVEKMTYRTSVVVGLPSKNALREPSNVTVGAGETENVSRSLRSTNRTPTQSRLALSLSPHAGDRQPVGENHPEDMTNFSGSSMLAQGSAATAPSRLTASVMPGSMFPSLDSSSSAAFPSSVASHISGLPPQSPPILPFPFVPTSPSSTFKPGSPGPNNTLDRHSQSLIQPSSPPLPTIRQRASSGCGTSHQNAAPSSGHYFHEGLRGRTATSGFAGKGEVRQADLVVMEVVIDSKMFRGEKYSYAIDVKARKRRKSEEVKTRAIPLGNEREITGKGSGSDSASINATSPTEYLHHLPFGYALYTMPSSPLHSSGLSSETPSRHLLRVTLPTAQYLVKSFWDPLAGEMRDPPPKPEWMQILEEGDQVWSGGIVVDAVVYASEEKEGASKKTSRERLRQIVLINGKEVGVVGEKESLSSIGREELLDARILKMGILSRIPNESQPLPDELKIPIGIAVDLLSPVLSRTSGTNPQSPLGSADDNGMDDESINGKRHGIDTPPKMEVGLTGGGISAGNGSIGEAHAQHAVTTGLSGGLAGEVAGGGGFLGFLQTYPNPFLTRFGFSGAGAGTRLGNISEGEKEEDTAMSKDEGATSGNGNNSEVTDIMAPITDTADETRRSVVTSGYPLSTLVFVALIAFLIGSLLRSLVSPADFVYVVSGVDAQHEAGGWREIRRLFEIKYLIGGWDFQIAVVRRH